MKTNFFKPNFRQRTETTINKVEINKKSYASVNYFKMDHPFIHGSTIMNLLDDFNVDCVKISNGHYFEVRHAEIILNIWENKATHLKSLIDNSLKRLEE